MEANDPPEGGSKLDERNQRIAEAFKKGESAERIALEFNLSAPAVRKVLQNLGVKREKGVSIPKDPLDKVLSPGHQKLGLRIYQFLHFDKVRTNTQVMEDLGWSVQKIASVTKGHFNVTLVDLQRLAQYMNTPLSELLKDIS